VEGSLRTGRLKNEFESADYIAAGGFKAAYNLNTRYLAAHAGLAYTIELSENNSFDIIGRYFWTKLQGAETKLPNCEPVIFDDARSQPLRLGVRVTHKKDENISWYIGAAYEHEFDGESNGRNEFGLEFDAPSLEGDAGVADIGLLNRSHPDQPLVH
jgi:outer membrane autotransporter protein